MTTNADIVRAAADAMVRGDTLALMGHLAPDIRWAIGAGSPDAAPWFGTYHGKREVLGLMGQLADVGPFEITDKAMVAEGDLVVTWVHVTFTGPNGRAVDIDEAHFWRVVDGRIASVDFLVDTAAVAAAFA